MANSYIILTFVVSIVVIIKGEDATSSTTLTPSSTTTTTTTTKAPVVPDRPIKEPGCYWTSCQSPLTYNLKCPPDTEEQNQNDEMPCPGIFVKYQCCPKTNVTTNKPKIEVIIGKDGVVKVVPEAV